MSTAPLILVSATRLDADAFHRDSLLGRCLALPAHRDYQVEVAFANQRPLGAIYNEALAQADQPAPSSSATTMFGSGINL